MTNGTPLCRRLLKLNLSQVTYWPAPNSARGGGGIAWVPTLGSGNNINISIREASDEQFPGSSYVGVILIKHGTIRLSRS